VEKKNMPVSEEDILLDIDKNKQYLISNIKILLKYQFGINIFSNIFEKDTEYKIEFSKNTGKLRHIFYKDELFLVFKPNVNKFSLTVKAGKYLQENTNPPLFRVKVLSEIQDYIKDGKSVFAKHVLGIDFKLRPNDEVIVVNEADEFLAVGKLCIPPYLHGGKSVGMAVEVRKGFNLKEKTK
jgi:archaeosine-15-forming tRNA-guanine transglycosylase